MAENIVSGLFGLDPYTMQQGLNANVDARAQRYGELDPIARVQQGWYKVGANLADTGAGLLGMANPQVAEAQKMSALAQGADISTPEDLMLLAKKFNDAGMPRQAAMAVQAAQQRQQAAQQRQKELVDLEAKKAEGFYHTAEGIHALNPPETKGDTPQIVQLQAYEQKYRAAGDTVKADQLAAQIKKLNEGLPKPTQLAQLNEDLKEGRITQVQHDDAVKKITNIPATMASVMQTMEPLTDGGKEVAKRFTLAAIPLPGGYGMYGAKIRNETLNGIAADIEAAGGNYDEAVGQRYLVKANAAALSKITNDITTFEPYKVMLDKNGSIAVDLGNKLMQTDSKLANKTINWLRQNATNNPNLSEYLAQVQIFTVEAARVLNNPRLVGQLSYEATRDMQGIISGDMPLESAIRVMDRLGNDGDNRLNSMMQEKKMLEGKLGVKGQVGEPNPTETNITPAPLTPLQRDIQETRKTKPVSVMTLPPAKEAKGKFATDPSTGVTLKSDGVSWTFYKGQKKGGK